MRIRTHAAGLFGWLFGDEDVYEHVDEGEIEHVYYPHGSTGDAFVGIYTEVRKKCGCVVRGYLDVDSM